MIVVLMGVSGAGKTATALALRDLTHWEFAEGDEFHSAANRARMAAGIPLTDEDRAPWLDALHQVLLEWNREQKNGILTCSALKKSYRAQLRQGMKNVKFVWLDPPRDLLEARLADRKGHYFNPALLQSQLSTLEPPEIGEGVIHLTGTAGPVEMARRILEHISRDDDAADYPQQSSN